MAPPAPPRPRDFTMGLLAHLILVPPWITAPFMLFGGLVAVGLPHGLPGVAGILGIGAGLVAAPDMKMRAPLCLVVAGLGAVAPSGRRVSSLAAAAVVSLLAWMCKGGKGDWKRRPALWKFLVRWRADYYAQAELRGDLESMQKGKSCFAFHPHGCLCAGFTINGCYNEDFMGKAGKVNWLCDYNLRYKNPFFRAICDMVRGEDHSIDAADKKTFQRLMASGESVALIPGGFQDAVAYEYQRNATVIKRRKGFVKYCLQYGYRLHPVYTFGESETYWAFSGLRRLRMKVCEQNIPMVAFFGWPLVPFLPRPDARILTYVGKSIDLPHIKEPSSEEVDKWHAEYIKALQALFEKHRAEAGFPDATLEVL